MPNMPYYRLYDWKDSPCDTIGMVVTKEPVPTGSFTLSPNPATDEIRLQFSQAAPPDAKILLFGMTGEAPRIAGGGAEIVVSTAGLPQGSYLLKVVAEGESFAPKLVLVVR